MRLRCREATPSTPESLSTEDVQPSKRARRAVSRPQGEHAKFRDPSAGTAIGFATIAEYEAPGWPSIRGTKQFHVDLALNDVDLAVRRCVELGASLPDDQPGETPRGLLDPSWHPFCLTSAASW